IPAVFMFLFTAITGLSHNFYLYMASQFMVGVGYGGFRMNGIILGKRSWGACLSQMFFAVGLCALAGLSYFVRDWRRVQFITAAPLGVVAFYIWFCVRYIPESARWLLDRGRVKEAREVLKKAAAINKGVVPVSLLNTVLKYQTQIKFQPKRMDRLETICWFSLNLTYYCLSFNVGNLGLDIFLTQLIFGLSEMPAHLLCIWLLEAVGRRVCLIGTLLGGGVTCLLIIAVGQGNAPLFSSVLQKMTIMKLMYSLIVYVQELFPTSLRQTASGLGNIACRAGGLLSPVVNMLVMYHWTIPIVVYSSLMFLSGALGFLLPETRRRELPDSTADVQTSFIYTSHNMFHIHIMNHVTFVCGELIYHMA
uniref:Solute carrier family 22 member 13a n=1 Tax=Neogobius melanostomus TaxID=47308 RepID=A0A8C6UBG5_9GOBI